MNVDYEVRKPLVGNLDVVGKFDKPTGPDQPVAMATDRRGRRVSPDIAFADPACSRRR